MRCNAIFYLKQQLYIRLSQATSNFQIDIFYILKQSNSYHLKENFVQTTQERPQKATADVVKVLFCLQQN